MVYSIEFETEVAHCGSVSLARPINFRVGRNVFIGCLWNFVFHYPVRDSFLSRTRNFYLLSNLLYVSKFHTGCLVVHKMQYSCVMYLNFTVAFVHPCCGRPIHSEFILQTQQFVLKCSFQLSLDSHTVMDYRNALAKFTNTQSNLPSDSFIFQIYCLLKNS